MNKASKIFLAFWNDRPVAINAILYFPGMIQNAVRCSRIVTLPDYQGLGIGSAFNNYIASIYKSNGFRYFIKTVNPALGLYHNNHPELWRATTHNGTIRRVKKVSRGFNKERKLKWFALERISYCHEYIGQGIDEQILLDNHKIYGSEQPELF